MHDDNAPENCTGLCMAVGHPGNNVFGPKETQKFGASEYPPLVTNTQV